MFTLFFGFIYPISALQSQIIAICHQKCTLTSPRSAPVCASSLYPLKKHTVRMQSQKKGGWQLGSSFFRCEVGISLSSILLFCIFGKMVAVNSIISRQKLRCFSSYIRRIYTQDGNVGQGESREGEFPFDLELVEQISREENYSDSGVERNMRIEGIPYQLGLSCFILGLISEV